MSRKKKTVEEKLEELLVPEEKQPYQLPENWVWTSINKIIHSMESRDPKKINSTTFHYIDVDAIDNQRQVIRTVKEVETDSAPSRAKRKVSKNDVIISLVRPYLKNIALIDVGDEKLVASTAFYVCSPKGNIPSRFIYNLLCSPIVTKYLIEHTRGDNSPSVRSIDFEKMQIPIPPINEQKRIADKVERLLNKIDEAKRLIEEVIESIDERKLAVLDKAIRGELGTNNSSEKGVDEILNKENVISKEEINFKVPDNWACVSLGAVCLFKRGPFGSAIKKSMFVPKGNSTYKVYEQGNAIRKSVDYGNYYISEEDFENLKGFKVNEGDVIVSCAGTIGETFVIPHNYEEGVINQALMRVSLSKALSTSYFLYAFDYYIKELAKTNAKGTAIKNLPPLAELKKYVIPIPPLEEQARIANIIDRIFMKFNAEKDSLANLLNEIEVIKQSILFKAYRGELGTNDPNEESAIELLKEVLQQK